MNQRLPRKYTQLNILSQAGFNTPPTLFISADTRTEPKTIQAVENFIKEATGDFIVRSAVSGEDDEATSFAGAFYSSTAVPAKQIWAAIDKGLVVNQQRKEDLGFKGPVGVMLQPFYSAELGGIVFTRWKYFSGTMVIDLAPTPQQAVAGQNTKTVVVDASGKVVYGTLNNKETKIVTALVKSLQKLPTTKPMDIEWLYTKKSGVVLLQMRPITASLSALKPASKLMVKHAAAALKKIKPGDWRQNELSENVGTLSPLSFSLLKHLYTQATPALQHLGFKGGDTSWLQRAQTGQIFCHEDRYKTYFSFVRWWTPFYLAYKKPFVLKTIQTEVLTVPAPKKFEVDYLSRIFTAWLQTNVYLASAKQSVLPTAALWGDYELGHPQSRVPAVQKLQTFNLPQLNAYLKATFFAHLELLKQDLSDQPAALWLDWESFKSSLPRDEVQTLIATDLDHSFYQLPADFNAKTAQSRHYLGSEKPCTGTIWDPRVQKIKPAKAVYFSPVFDNQYAGIIPQLQGIVVQSGSPLSHSAIVAREHNIPYIVDNTADFHPGEKVDL